MATMLCLANSVRPGGRCVAGIDVDTDRWIRPVPQRGGGIRLNHTRINGQILSVLDIVSLDIELPHLSTRFQRENCIVRSWNWQIVGRAHPADILQYCDDTVPILHSGSDRVDPAHLAAMPPEQWQSLQLLRPQQLTFEPDFYQGRRWRATFSDRRGREYYLKVIDPVACGRLNRGEQISMNCLLTVSLAEPWAPPNHSSPERCYKLVAAVIEL